MTEKFKYKRVLLKLSGEYLKGDLESGIDGEILLQTARLMKKLQDGGVELGVVLGGGNIWRHRDFAHLEIDRSSSDAIGMMANLMNSLALESVLLKIGAQARAMSSFPCEKAMENYAPKRARHHLDKGKIVIFAGGTGNPFFTTDSAAALRALEMDCELMLKATRVDFVYDKDPEQYADAKKFEQLSYQEVIEKELRVMDLTCAALAKDGGLPILVFNFEKEGNLEKALRGEKVGTMIR